MTRIKKCCICGKIFRGYGNNTEPVKDKGSCCDSCNYTYVIPERIIRVTERMIEREG